MSNIAQFILFNKLTKEQQDVLVEVKYRIGTRHFKPLNTVKELISLGLIAGDYSKLYVTDKGDSILGVNKYA